MGAAYQARTLLVALLAAYGVLDRLPIEDADPDADRDGQLDCHTYPFLCLLTILAIVSGYLIADGQEMYHHLTCRCFYLPGSVKQTSRTTCSTEPSGYCVTRTSIIDL